MILKNILAVVLIVVGVLFLIVSLVSLSGLAEKVHRALRTFKGYDIGILFGTLFCLLIFGLIDFFLIRGGMNIFKKGKIRNQINRNNDVLD